jgi:hypothetical protein
MMGETAAGYGITYAKAQLKYGGYTAPSLLPWMMSFFTVTLCLNMLCTGTLSIVCLRSPSQRLAQGMIIARIWKVSHSSVTSQVSGSRRALDNLVRIIIESGLIYSAHSLILLVVVSIHSLAFYPVADSVSEASTPSLDFSSVYSSSTRHLFASTSSLSARVGIDKLLPTMAMDPIRLKFDSGRGLPGLDVPLFRLLTLSTPHALRKPAREARSTSVLMCMRCQCSLCHVRPEYWSPRSSGRSPTATRARKNLSPSD